MTEQDANQKALAEAIRFEVDGRAFFLQAAEKAKNYFAKVIFQTIAQEELKHIERVKKIHDRTASKGGDTSPSSFSEKGTLQNIFQQAKEQMDRTMTVSVDEMEAVRLAIQLEIKGQEFYGRLAAESTGDAERAFFQELAQEESVHFSVLRDMEQTLMKGTSFG